jgi:hypothetical protein
VNAPQRRRIPGPRPELAVEIAKAELDGSAIYELAQHEARIYMTHEQAVLVAAELMDAHDEEERRQASL